MASVSQIAGENYDGVTMPGDDNIRARWTHVNLIRSAKAGTCLGVKETASNPVAGSI